MSGDAYALDNHHAAATAHHRALAELLDPHTTGRITGLCDPSALRRCLEVGAGGGSVARWLADRLGPGGEVMACDLKPELIGSHPKLRTVAYDLCSDQPAAEVLGSGFDLILARLILLHLPQRRAVLHRLVDLLAPGGVLLVEDWAALRDDVVIDAPSPAAAVLYQRYQHAVGAAFDHAGVDRTWARQIHPAMVHAGLTDVETEVHARYWTGGGPGMRLVAAVQAQLRPQLLAAGFSQAELDALVELVADPRLVVHGHPLYSTSGRRPG